MSPGKNRAALHYGAAKGTASIIDAGTQAAGRFSRPGQGGETFILGFSTGKPILGKRQLTMA